MNNIINMAKSSVIPFLIFIFLMSSIDVILEIGTEKSFYLTFVLFASFGFMNLFLTGDGNENKQ